MCGLDIVMVQWPMRSSKRPSGEKIPPRKNGSTVVPWWVRPTRSEEPARPVAGREMNRLGAVRRDVGVTGSQVIYTSRIRAAVKL